MADFFSAISKSTTRRLVLANTPWFTASAQTPVGCAMINHLALSNCNATVAKNIDPVMTQALAQVAARKLAIVVPVQQLFCVATTCPVVAADRFIYTDSHHIGHDWSIYVARALGQRLSQLLGLPAIS
jgi:hypothetical protein